MNLQVRIIQPRPDGLDHILEALVEFLNGHVEHGPASSLKPGVTTLVVRLGMCVAVDLDYEALAYAGKVGEIRSDRMLTAEPSS